jgi:broad specificity phosphatase PhoE
LKTKKIILLRHGQTDFNLKGIVQGSGVDSPLNENGRKQADAFYRAYRNYGFDKVFTSALKRTHQTVQGFIDDGLSWEIVPELNEISWGNFEGQPITPEEDVYYRWVLAEWSAGKTDLRIKGGENPEEVAVRLAVALDLIMNSPNKNILVCMHGRAMRILLCMMMNLPIKEMDLFEHQNCCVYELEFDGVAFKVLRHCDVKHLENLFLVS